MVVGHQKQLEFLKRSAAADKLAHAYLFWGPAKIGKKAAAMELVSHLFGMPVSEGKAHPDFIFAAPDAETKNLKIETVRDLIWRLSLTPASAPIKAAVIDAAHFMTQDSQNCLLKTLEEPSKGSLLILIADNPRLLLPTITSRCEKIKFSFVSTKEITAFLAKMAQKGAKLPGEEVMRDIARLSFGRPGRAIEFIAQPEKLKKWRDSLKELAAVASGNLSARFKYVGRVVETEDLGEILEIWQFYFRELMVENLNKKTGASVPPSASAPKKVAFTRPGSGIPPLERIRRALQAIHKTNYLLATTNVNAKLALENLMMEI